MGVYSREYYQDDSQPPLLVGIDIPITRGYVLLLVGCFFLQLFFPMLDQHFYLDNRVWSGQVWRLLTYSLLHDRHSLLHLLFNALSIWFVGGNVERMRSRRDYLQLVFLSAVFGSLSHLAVMQVMGANVPCLGASAVFFGMFIFLAALFPNMPVSVFGLITVELRWLAIGFAAIDILSLASSLAGGRLEGISYASHVGGMIVGLTYARYGHNFVDWINGSLLSRFLRARRQAWTTRQLRIVREDQEDLDDQVDTILQKISAQGSDSLTAKERAILETASARYKKRS